MREKEYIVFIPESQPGRTMADSEAQAVMQVLFRSMGESARIQASILKSGGKDLSDFAVEIPEVSCVSGERPTQHDLDLALPFFVAQELALKSSKYQANPRDYLDRAEYLLEASR